MRNIGKAIRYFLTAVLILMAIMLAAGRLVGVQAYQVLSGSMEPAYPTGSVIFVRRAGTQLRPGDVITFRLSDGLVATHRIIEVCEDGGHVSYRTKGDANAVADGGTVPESSVVGSPIFMIPYLGYLTAYLQHPAVRMVLLAVLIIALALSFRKKDSEEYPQEKRTSYSWRDHNDGKAIRQTGGGSVSCVADREGLSERVLDRGTDMPVGAADSERVYDGVQPE